MKIGELEYQGFDWDRYNLEKIGRKHGLAREEVELFFVRAALAGQDTRHSEDETRYLAYGKDENGRPMMAVFTLRQRGGSTDLRVMSARRMREKEWRRYEKEKTA